MTRDEFVLWAQDRGWNWDHYGHLQKTVEMARDIKERQYRFKISRIAVRYEVKANDIGWIRLRSGYFKDLHITPEGKLDGMTR